jgi:hypothetical protein
VSGTFLGLEKSHRISSFGISGRSVIIVADRPLVSKISIWKLQHCESSIAGAHNSSWAMLMRVCCSSRLLQNAQDHAEHDFPNFPPARRIGCAKFLKGCRSGGCGVARRIGTATSLLSPVNKVDKSRNGLGTITIWSAMIQLHCPATASTGSVVGNRDGSPFNVRDHCPTRPWRIPIS